MFSAALLKIADRVAGGVIQRRMEVIQRTDPRRIYVENVRQFFGIPNSWARLICAQAVREGVFERSIGLLCPIDQNVIASFDRSEEIPEFVTCTACELDGREPYVYATGGLQRLEYFKYLGHEVQA